MWKDEREGGAQPRAQLHTENTGGRKEATERGHKQEQKTAMRENTQQKRHRHERDQKTAEMENKLKNIGFRKEAAVENKQHSGRRHERLQRKAARET